ncbi:hypothetical protein BTA35_0207325 [Oceanospirillum linum]|uniref:Sensory/regulatory protein RpfC n=1 Tax=Oceanospirillum linum TaxID=966 RepID=A0A1T1HD76_OCELI|nr:hypothetical protein BTA35_0207325 [Oceanospirillum linum]SEG11718.1 PAS domain S-box-containing protein/diguanylate cyclase (GGDEF) domain-containing protein [Oleiphilus messinensis]SMP09295.1 PAS domain S-box-containing protein/diguanylate cyclase (GGDEF) domain-containing protein [Oceanospirillum linum]
MNPSAFKKLKTGLSCYLKKVSGLYASVFLCGIFWLPQTTFAVSFDHVFETQDIPLLWIKPFSGEIVEVNQAAADFYGYSRKVLQEMSIQDINTFDPEQVFEERRAASAEGRNYFIFRHQLASGEIRTVEVYSHPYERNGQQLLLSVIHDITPGRNLDQGMWHYQQRLEELVAIKTKESIDQSHRIITLLVVGLVMAGGAVLILIFVMRKRRSAEQESQRFQAIADNAIYGNIISDFDGKVIYVNPFFAEVHGYKAEDVVGQLTCQFHTEEQMEQVNELMADLKEYGHISPREIWHQHRDGYTFPMLMSSTVMEGRDGEPVYIATAALDLTEQYRERQQTEKILIEARENAEQANQAKSDFLANMSHEIRTPLNAIIGLSESQLTSPDLSEEVYRHLQQIHSSGQLLLGIVNDLLDFSEIEAGKVSILSEPFNLQQILEQLSTLFGLASSKKGLELVLNLPANIPHCYQGDALRLTQVLTNLMANAVKFTDKGLVELEVTALDEKIDSALLRFSLKDTGIGLTQEQQAHLFQAFSQADNSITRRHGGTGLGLIISQKLVSLMGSEQGIELESTPGEGSCFYFDLELPFSPVTEDQRLPMPCTTHPCQALIVDDQPIARQVLREILQSWGFDVTEAEDGDIAVQRVEQALSDNCLYDLILMDWDMPRMNGLVVLQSIQDLLHQNGHSENLPAMLMVSAYERSEIDLECVENVLYLPKPVHQSSLYEALGALQARLAPDLNISDTQRFRQQKILVVEDNLINQQVVQAQLEQMNLQVVLAENGLLGIEAVRREVFDLILMDIQMPVMDGYQTTQEIRCFNQEVPIIALTAAALIEDREKALQAGMNDHLGKPFTKHQLFDHLKPWLETEETGGAARSGGYVQKAATPDQSSDPAILAELNQKQTVLIVDDVPANVKVLASLLKDEYVVQVANSGQKALSITQGDHPPDLVLLDIMMPDIDGYDVCRQLKANPRTSRIPIIFISALDEVSDEAKGLQLGAVDYIAKPYHPDIVKARVRSHMILKQKSDMLEEMSNIDGLTQVANRRYLDTKLSTEVRRLQRSHKPLGLVMLDIDHFKSFNDNYGHGKGDECLVKVASALRRVVNRPGDIFARYGGEEFIAILPETDPAGVRQIAEEMRKAVESMAVTHEFSPVADVVTVSLGGFSKCITNESAEMLLAQVDQALYRAKKQGRNQVVMV